VGAGARFAIASGMRFFSLMVLCATAACVEPALDCLDNGPLEAAITDGDRAALADNAAAHDRGRLDGLALTAADGARDGQSRGYDDGSSAGYQGRDGYAAGYSSGAIDGGGAGASDPIACASGASDGEAEGNDAGYRDGYSAAESDGYDTGYADGFSDGAGTCTMATRTEAAQLTPHSITGLPLRAKDPSPRSDQAPAVTADAPSSQDVAVCYQRGYIGAVDSAAYKRGRDEGVQANTVYQARFRAEYQAAYAAGLADGNDRGFDDGYDAGYASAYRDSYENNYDVCYGGAYADAYDRGHTDGQGAGYSPGYDAGYAVGNEDGSDCE
jgi:flagellar biosynthesis/type III secretory pathway protein FliH